MGYGEFDGGGSVGWKIDHGDKSNNSRGNGNKDGGRGHDHQNTDNADIVIWLNGVVVGRAECNTSRVVVAWGPEAGGVAARGSDFDPRNIDRAARIKKLKEELDGLLGPGGQS